MAVGRRSKPTRSRLVDSPREDCGPDTPLDQCRCRAAVTRAYASMIASGVADCVALDAATRVYRYHHPEVADQPARLTVETWVLRATATVH
jgi:hypothetical protein